MARKPNGDTHKFNTPKGDASGLDRDREWHAGQKAADEAFQRALAEHHADRSSAPTAPRPR